MSCFNPKVHVSQAANRCKSDSWAESSELIIDEIKGLAKILSILLLNVQLFRELHQELESTP